MQTVQIWIVERDTLCMASVNEVIKVKATFRFNSFIIGL